MFNKSLLAFIVSVILPSACFGYLWRETPSITEEMNEVDLVCIVRATFHQDLIGADDLVEATRWELAVSGTLKGLRRKTISVLCLNDSGRFPMEDGHTYLIFAKKYATGDTYHIDTTGNSQELTEGKKKTTEPNQRLQTVPRRVETGAQSKLLSERRSYLFS